MSWFYLTSAGEVKGPLAFNALERMYIEKQLTLDTQLWNGSGVSEWTPLKSLPELVEEMRIIREFILSRLPQKSHSTKSVRHSRRPPLPPSHSFSRSRVRKRLPIALDSSSDSCDDDSLTGASRSRKHARSRTAKTESHSAATTRPPLLSVSSRTSLRYSRAPAPSKPLPQLPATRSVPKKCTKPSRRRRTEQVPKSWKPPKASPMKRGTALFGVGTKKKLKPKPKMSGKKGKVPEIVRQSSIRGAKRRQMHEKAATTRDSVASRGLAVAQSTTRELSPAAALDVCTMDDGYSDSGCTVLVRSEGEDGESETGYGSEYDSDSGSQSDCSTSLDSSEAAARELETGDTLHSITLSIDVKSRSRPQLQRDGGLSVISSMVVDAKMDNTPTT